METSRAGDLEVTGSTGVRQGVEVEGIEPSSFSFATGLLRAQPVEDLGPSTFTGNGERPQSAEVSRSEPLTRSLR